MKNEINSNYHFSVKNINFFKNALSLLNVDDVKSNINFKRNKNDINEKDRCVLFNLYRDGLMIRSLSKCKQIYCFLYMDSNCFSMYNMSKIKDQDGVVEKIKTNESGCLINNVTDNYATNKKINYDYDDKISVNSDELFTTHVLNDANKEVIKLKTVSPLKNQYTETNENEFDIRKKIYEAIDDNEHSLEFLVSPYELLSALDFLDPVILNIKFDCINKTLIVQLTDEDGDTSETFISIIVDYYYQICKLERYSFLNDNYTYFYLQSKIFSFYLDYLIKSNDHYITFEISEYINDTTSVLKMETKNKNYQRMVCLMPKEIFDDFNSLSNQTFHYRVKDISKILQALKISSHLRMDFQENGLLRLQFTLKEYNMNGTHLCYFIQPLIDICSL
ncbi:conserved protein, unknown function [Hepatocystis sp. ex Piliocolobus tephrosceles]|nr:conserved protein, unknown function [Hepatocystis sp. ex Piliocolobus tephrosceles]